MAERRSALVARLSSALPVIALVLIGLGAGRGAALAGVAALAPGVALAAASLMAVGGTVTESQARWLVAAGAIAGLATVAPPGAVVAMAGVLGALVLLAPRLPHHPVWSAVPMALLCALFTLVLQPAASLTARIVAVGIQCGLGVVVALAATADRVVVPVSDVDNDARRVLLAPALCAGACAAGLADLPGDGVASAAVVVAYSLWAAGDAAEGILAGAAAGLAAGAALGPAIPAVGAAAFGGAAAGLFRRRSAWAWPVAGFAGNLLAAVLSAEPAWGWTAGAALGAGAAALAVARRSGQDGTVRPIIAANASGKVGAGPSSTLVEHLRASAQACMALGRDLATMPLLPGGGEQVPDFGLRIAEEVCPGCPALTACWERKLPRARRMVAEVWRLAQTGPVSWHQVGGPESIHCLRPREMAEAANRLVALGRQREEFLRLLAQSRRSVLSPLMGIGRDLADLAEQAAAVEPPVAPRAARDLRSLATERWSGAPAAAGGLAYEAASAALARPGRTVNGDTVRCRLLRGDRLAIVLSDGMGSGEPAAVISAAASEHLLACLATGRSALDALRQTNEQMVADGGVERFATLDLALVHLRSGLLEWYKMGAPPGLLAHPRGVRELAGGGLPAGILPVPEIRSGRVRLRSGDTIALVSDGVLDRPAGLLTGHGHGGRARWVAEWLGPHARQTSPLGVARGLLEVARQRVAGGEHDDLTAVVCRFQEAGGAGGDAYGKRDAAGSDPASSA